MSGQQAEPVQRRLLDWYAAHARDLPWRNNTDPYAVLVSEVMLQQTQVDRVIPKWHAWLERFPTLASLASATPADAIRAWQGLGYNLRAVRLHAIALQAVSEYRGELPHTLDALLRLKGIGRYTAGAVACFAFGQPVAFVDTNVRRVLARVFDVPMGGIDVVADQVLPSEHAYAWNQALMDLGATICRAERPLCLLCPLVEVCAAPGMAATRVRVPKERFASSSRYYRGRILDRLRTLPEGDAVHADVLAAELQTDIGHIQRLLRRLEIDGLLRLDEHGCASLPTAAPEPLIATDAV